MSLEDAVEEYTVDMKQVRNSPSIVMWEIFNEGVSKDMKDKVFNAFYPPIYNTDTSRFIMPLKGYYTDDPRVAKGGQIDSIGYGKEWKALRDEPLDHLGNYEDSNQYGMYAVEFGELTGQDNWDLVKVKPWYKVFSYEWSPVLYTIKCVVDGKELELLISEEGRIIKGK